MTIDCITTGFHPPFFSAAWEAESLDWILQDLGSSSASVEIPTDNLNELFAASDHFAEGAEVLRPLCPPTDAFSLRRFRQPYRTILLFSTHAKDGSSARALLILCTKKMIAEIMEDAK